jgi:hypothetical protein
MTVHQCPDCTLAFRHRPVLIAHLRDEHPTFRSEYLAAHEEPSHRWPFERDDFPTAQGAGASQNASAQRAQGNAPVPSSRGD